MSKYFDLAGEEVVEGGDVAFVKKSFGGVFHMVGSVAKVSSDGVDISQIWGGNVTMCRRSLEEIAVVRDSQ